MNYDSIIQDLALGVELIGIFALIAGGILATGLFIRDLARAGMSGAYQGYRANLGRAILLGLEILIIADIIGTVAVEPSFENLGVLALIVLIRTFLSFALEIEISGRLPWRGAPKEGSAAAGGV